MTNDQQLGRSFSLATGIGSLPHREVQRACDFLEENFRDSLLFWPQLVKRSFNENMYVQYSQGLPGVKIDVAGKKIYIDTQTEEFLKQLEDCYLHILNNDREYFAVSSGYAAGFYESLRRIKKLPGLKFFKGQIIGPISFGLSVTDEKQAAIIHHAEFSQVLVKVLGLKAKWQIRKIKEANPAVEAVIFIDEPYLVSVGSSFISLSKEKIAAALGAMVAAIHEEEALAGIHCCGNTDWGLVLACGIDILSFDAFNYADNLLLFAEALQAFLKRGGVLAWGIVPTDKENLSSAAAGVLIKRIKAAAQKSAISLDKVIITPSCGCGTLDEASAQRAHLLAKAVAAGLA
ncbi:MAG: hypothetical protein ACOY3D_08750 [Candidatus Omnitrophota bacterium]